MEGKEVECEDRIEEDESVIEKDVGERRFKVGELVEFWEVALVRGYRTDSGDPAWVKADYGGGEYGIKMVTNTRGKLRRVHWKQLYKDGSFNKLKIREGGARGRTTDRIREIELGKAEAKFAGKLKEQATELKRAESEINDMQEQGENSRRLQEMKAKQAEKDMSLGHKRQLLELRHDQDKKRKTDTKAQEEIEREQRIKTQNLERQLKNMGQGLSVTKAEREELQKAVNRGKEKLGVLREYGDEWQRKYIDQIENKEQKMEEQIRELDRDIKDKVKKVREVERMRTLLEERSANLEEKLREREEEFEALAEHRRQVINIFRAHLLYFL
jgi:chromosome segregation ATPase